METAATSKQHILARSPFAGLPGESQSALLDLAALEQLPRRHAITTQGEPTRSLLVIGSGRVKIERMREDRAVPLGHRGPGHLIGETALSGAATATESASVVDDVEALVIPLVPLRQTMAADARLRAAVADAIVEQHRELELRLVGLLLHGVEARLAAFLLDAADRWGRPHPEGELVTAPFTHAEIAQLIGSTRETVTLVLGKLKREGLLAFDHRRVIIRDRAMLAQRAAAPAA
ncbi:cAMP-binding protein [Minicystis rosea]|nr:cAMP-binding protein [Minicystis rosea]